MEVRNYVSILASLWMKECLMFWTSNRAFRMLVFISNFCCFFSVNQKEKKCIYQSFWH
jgi:hypothetical protein